MIPPEEGDSAMGAEAGEKEGGTLTLADLMAEINGSKEEIVVKIDSVVIDVNFLSTDLRKIADRVTETVGKVSELQREVKELKDTMTNVSKMTAHFEEMAENTEGRSNRKNFVGFPERVEGQSADLFLEEWIVTVLHQKMLSKFFSIERGYTRYWSYRRGLRCLQGQ
ncbi:hypothetical protein NDU88_002313 [Pleurodeles waltl]|uniref:Uncharacterized protein n=1 Tax=Pleurodeles waltl TaxID=8319 RepID=A0AAV7WRA5_PLEWA|nr:hypothetical protein NDU88_002313 [Pleurodeles waltl]